MEKCGCAAREPDPIESEAVQEQREAEGSQRGMVDDLGDIPWVPVPVPPPVPRPVAPVAPAPAGAPVTPLLIPTKLLEDWRDLVNPPVVPTA